MILRLCTDYEIFTWVFKKFLRCFRDGEIDQEDPQMPLSCCDKSREYWHVPETLKYFILEILRYLKNSGMFSGDSESMYYL